jgi:signal transduction histidine kinase
MKAIDQWADYRKAYGFMNKNIDSAFYYFNRSATNSPDKKQVASAYQSMALIQTNAGDNYGAQESLINSLRSLDEEDPQDRDYLARDYNGLGMSSYNLNQFGQALNYYTLALRYAGDRRLRCNILNNRGNAAKELKSYAKALQNYDAAMKITDESGATYARILTNMAITKWLQNPPYNAAPELWRSLNIRIHENDVAGQNSSYAHLSEFYTKSHPDSARWYAQKMRTIADVLHNPDEQLSALGKLIVLSTPEKSKAYFEQYRAIKDSTETKRNAAKNQFALIRYNVEKARTENLELQKESNQRRYQLIAVLAAAGLAAILGIWLYRKRRQRLQSEAEREIRESRLQLSQKVHDQVANGIYSIMSEVEHTQELNKTNLINRLDNIYEVSRNIAHDEPGEDDDFTRRVNSLLNAFKRPAIRLAVSGNEPELWQQVRKDAKQHLELVLQELMVNMSKHSQATLAHVGFLAEQGWLKIECRDNGVGMTNPDQAGKGLKNTVSRIKRLNGSITFDTQAATGFCVFIQLPLTLS